MRLDGRLGVMFCPRWKMECTVTFDKPFVTLILDLLMPPFLCCNIEKQLLFHVVIVSRVNSKEGSLPERVLSHMEDFADAAESDDNLDEEKSHNFCNHQTDMSNMHYHCLSLNYNTLNLSLFVSFYHTINFSYSKFLSLAFHTLFYFGSFLVSHTYNNKL